MPLTIFDTHAAVTALRDAGIDEDHAAAIVNTVRDARVDDTDHATKADLAHFATKADLDRFATKADLETLRSELRWMLAFQAALILAMAAKLFGIV